jgi:predicted SnoaL-like aldol condensation-catalyzing enzyme
MVSRVLWLVLFLPHLVSLPISAQGYLSAVETNKKVVFDFYRLIVEPRNTDLAEVYLAQDFVDHDAIDRKGIEYFTKVLKEMTPAATDEVGPSLLNPPTFIMAQANLVTWLFKQNVSDPKDKSKTVERFLLEVYRIKDRKIAEHWKGTTSLPCSKLAGNRSK